jgi:hypothetical protein
MRLYEYIERVLVQRRQLAPDPVGRLRLRWLRLSLPGGWYPGCRAGEACSGCVWLKCVVLAEGGIVALQVQVDLEAVGESGLGCARVPSAVREGKAPCGTCQDAEQSVAATMHHPDAPQIYRTSASASGCLPGQGRGSSESGVSQSLEPPSQVRGSQQCKLCSTNSAHIMHYSIIILHFTEHPRPPASCELAIPPFQGPGRRGTGDDLQYHALVTLALSSSRMELAGPLGSQVTAQTGDTPGPVQVPDRQHPLMEAFSYSTLLYFPRTDLHQVIFHLCTRTTTTYPGRR